MRFLILIPLFIACAPSAKDDTTDLSDTDETTAPDTTDDTTEDTGYTLPDGVESGECLYTVGLDTVVGAGMDWSVWMVDGQLLEYHINMNPNDNNDWWYTYTYDEDGRVLVEEEHQGDPESLSGVNSISRSYTYDGDGLLLQKESDSDIDGVVEWVTTYTYDEEGRLAVVEREDAVAGEIVEQETYTYEIDGDEEITTRTLDEEVDGIVDEIRVSIYDSDLNRLTELRDVDGDGSYDSQEIHWYDEIGDTVLSEYDEDGDGSFEIQVQTDRSYDELSRLIEVAIDDGLDGVLDYVDNYTYLSSSHVNTIEYYRLSGGNVPSTGEAEPDLTLELSATMIYDYSACDLSSID